MEIPYPHIFKQYDIRGIVGSEITPDIAEHIGRAVGTLLRRAGQSDLVVGRDGRLSGPELAERFIRGALSAGVDVLVIGLVPTPVVYFALHRLEAGGAVAVTASHNPPEYNGFKICRGTDSVFGDELLSLRGLVEAEAYESGAGRLAQADVLPDYVDYLSEQFGSLPSRPRVVLDAGNGAAGLTAPEVFRRMNCRVVELYCNVDGRFPNHEADPTVEENLDDLIGLVRSQKAALGIAFDGDGDRIGVVDEDGEILRGDQILLLYARELLKHNPGAEVLSEVKASRVLYDEIARLGGRPVMWKTGHSLIKARMKETGVPLAGEMSGHMFFADRYFGFDDALYAACRLVELLERSGKSLKEMRLSIPASCNTPEIRIPCEEYDKERLVGALREHYRKTCDVVDIDGVRVTFAHGWGLVRCSNTQPILVLRFEADSPEHLAGIQETVMADIARFRKELGIL